MKLQAHGIETDLPLGWEGRIALRHPPAGPETTELSDGDATEQPDPETTDDFRATDTPDTSVLSEAAPFGISGSPEDLEAPTAQEAPAQRSAPPTLPTAPPSDVEQHFPVAHLANFPLPEDRGDFGSGAVDIMTADDILVVLAEFGAECVNTPLFAPRDLPTKLTPNMFSGSALQRSHQGQAGCQIFFTHANRAFCLYTVLGRQSSANRVLPQANATLAATRIAPR